MSIVFDCVACNSVFHHVTSLVTDRAVKSHVDVVCLSV